MTANPIAVMLYVELGLFLAGIGCLTVARIFEVFDETTSATRDEIRGDQRGFVLSRLGT